MMPVLIDFHSHILPCVDDGSKNVGMSLDMLRRQWEHGVGHVMLTPHFYPEHDTPEHFLSARSEAFRRLQEACAGQENLPKCYLGAEVAYFRSMSESDALPELCLHDTKYILVELPMTRWDEQIYKELADIRHKQGLTPVIAHVDRYLPRFGAKKMLTKLAQLPVLMQINAAALLRKSTASLMLWAMERGIVHLLGSDSHDMTERAPDLAGAVQVIERKLGRKALERFNEMGEMILNIPVAM